MKNGSAVFAALFSLLGIISIPPSLAESWLDGTDPARVALSFANAGRAKGWIEATCLYYDMGKIEWHLAKGSIDTFLGPESRLDQVARKFAISFLENTLADAKKIKDKKCLEYALRFIK